MATRTESRVVYAAGVAQGIVLVTFPAASTVFTDPSEYDLSNTQYGFLFLPQVITAIASALLGASLGRRFGTKRVYLAGLVAALVSMVVLIVSAFLTDDQTAAYVLLLFATACLGAGFGLSVPALNTFAGAFHPAGVDRAILVLNALLGLGTVLAPVLVSLRLPLQTHARQPASGRGRLVIPRRLWVYAVFAVLYGVCETVNGNWSQLDMTSELGASKTEASFALTAFWAMVTLGRVLFAAVQRRLPARTTYHLLPFLLAGAFVVIAVLPDDRPALGVLAFGLAGLGCSALLPLTISFGQEELKEIAATVAGGVIACYQLGYGIAAFGIGPLLDTGVGLPTIYGLAAVVAVVMGAWSFAVAQRRPSPASLHPDLGHATE
jgi:MFS family permease